MARVDIKEPRIQSSSFALYRTSAGGDESIIVRRKVGEPTDVRHTKSRKLIRQRANLSLASHHYSQLTPSQKAITRHQFEEVEFQKSHGKTDTKLLMGRQLFISKEIHSLETTGQQLVLPYELCIMLVDENLLPLKGELWLRYLKDFEWLDCGKEELTTGNWLFKQVPRGQEAYRPYGEVENYFDPELPEHQFMTEQEIRVYHYHQLIQILPHIFYFSSRFWSVHHIFVQPAMPTTTIEIYSQLETYAFTGTLIVGLKKYSADIMGEPWIAYQTHEVSASDPDPKEYDTTLADLDLIQGQKYVLVHQLPGNGYNLWKGYVCYYLLP